MAKTVLITGGSRGIGAQTALLAASGGYDVVVNYAQSAAKAEEICAQIAAAGQRALAIKADVGDEAQIEAMFARIDEEFGTLSALINNAGMLHEIDRVENMTAARLNEVMRINVTGSFICAREAIKRMSVRQGGNGGVIVNVSSAASRLGSPNEFVDYAASKGAIDSFTIGLSKELGADQIRVNAVRPGLIYTDIHASAGRPDRVDALAGNVPMQRGGSAKEVAEAIYWLMSDEASYISGALLDVTGGR